MFPMDTQFRIDSYAPMFHIDSNVPMFPMFKCFLCSYRFPIICSYVSYVSSFTVILYPQIVILFRDTSTYLPPTVFIGKHNKFNTFP